MPDILHLLLGDSYAGRLEQEKGEPRLIYDRAWLDHPLAYPLSTSMPLAGRSFESGRVRPFLEGLLPDDPEVRRRWGLKFGVSHNNPFGLLAHVGEDCPGACRFVTEERFDGARTGSRDHITWLSEDEMAARITELEADRTAWLGQSANRGYFSLAGAQSKFAVLKEGDRWGIPAGRIPTTHIIKPAIPGLPGILENEHETLEAARDAGLDVVNTKIGHWKDKSALVIERYDRQVDDQGRIVRIHQEDLCQTLSVPPSRKYQNEGGPSPAQIASVLRDVSVRPGADLDALQRWLRFSVEVASTDGHAKNLSLLIEPEGQIRLAPFYDMISMLPYPEVEHPMKLKMAMKIGGEYRRTAIGDRHWERLAGEMK